MNPFKIDKALRKVQMHKRRLPILLTNQAERYFTDSFKLGRLGSEKWKEVQRRIPGTDAYKYPKKKGLSRRTKPILIMSGKLRRKTSRSVHKAEWNNMMLVVDLPYAAVHNNGSRRVPRRSYMRHTRELGQKQLRLIKEHFRKTW